ncbi:MAG TPA: hypothetical protein DCS93_38130 [Microscillaceae bacterium]|nr:hypothetical protein [Microscillaceae bacterium]
MHKLPRISGLLLGLLLFSLSHTWAKNIPVQPQDTTKNKLNIKMGFMDNKLLDKILRKEAKEVKGRLGQWELNYHGALILVITDEKNNRMRIISPVVEEGKLTAIHYTNMLKAQFHKVLDVKYAIFNKFLWSVFAHPLKELTPAQVKDALKQVFFANQTFGSSYQSTNLVFGSGDN